MHILDEGVHTLMMVCLVGNRPDLWRSFDSALQRFGSNLSPIQTVAATTFGDPQHSDPRTLERLDQIIAGLRDETDPARIVRVAIAANFVGRMERCRDPLQRVVADGRRGGAVASSVIALLMLTDDEFLAGRWDAARQLAEEGIALCDTRGYSLLAWPGRYALALIAAAVGDDGRCRGLITDMLQWAMPRGALIVATYARHTAGIAALGRGEWQQAYAMLTSVNPPGVFGSREAYALWTMFDVVEAAVRSGHRAEAAAHLAAAVAGHHAAIAPRQAFLCAGAAAMIADDADAPGLFDKAAAMVSPDHSVRARPPGTGARGTPAPTESRDRRQSAPEHRSCTVRPTRRRALGCSSSDRAASNRAAPPIRLARRDQADPPGTRGRPTRGDRNNQSADRRAALPLPENRFRPPLPYVPETRCDLACWPTRCPRRTRRQTTFNRTHSHLTDAVRRCMPHRCIQRHRTN